MKEPGTTAVELTWAELEVFETIAYELDLGCAVDEEDQPAFLSLIDKMGKARKVSSKKRSKVKA